MCVVPQQGVTPEFINILGLTSLPKRCAQIIALANRQVKLGNVQPGLTASLDLAWQKYLKREDVFPISGTGSSKSVS